MDHMLNLIFMTLSKSVIFKRIWGTCFILMMWKLMLVFLLSMLIYSMVLQWLVSFSYIYSKNTAKSCSEPNPPFFPWEYWVGLSKYKLYFGWKWESKKLSPLKDVLSKRRLIAMNQWWLKLFYEILVRIFWYWFFFLYNFISLPSWKIFLHLYNFSFHL